MNNLILELLSETYKEGEHSIFIHKNKKYSVDEFLTRSKNLPITKVEVSKFIWVKKYVQDIDYTRVSKADLKYPILYTIDKKYGYVVLDGFHRVINAYINKVKFINGKEIPSEWL